MFIDVVGVRVPSTKANLAVYLTFCRSKWSCSPQPRQTGGGAWWGRLALSHFEPAPRGGLLSSDGFDQVGDLAALEFWQAEGRAVDAGVVVLEFEAGGGDPVCVEVFQRV